MPTVYQTLFNARKPSLFALAFWQIILADLKINLDLVSQALLKWAISVVNYVSKN